MSYRLYRLVGGIRHRLQRRLTPGGWLVITGLILTGAMAVDPDQSIAYQAFALLTGVLLVSWAGTLRFHPRFAVARDLPRLATVGEPVAYTLRLRNLSARRQSGLEAGEELAEPRLSFEEYLDFLRGQSGRQSFRLLNPPRPRAAQATFHPVPPIPPGQEVELRVILTPLRRGALRFRGVTAARTDPLGLCRALWRLPLPQTLLVLPRRYLLPPLALPGTMKYQQGGVALAASVGESEEFISLREYRRGDPLRHVHWKSWARVGRPVVKEFQDEFFVRHALILDTFAGTGAGEAFEEAVALAASFACTIQTQESLLDLMFVGPEAFCFTTGRGVAHTEQMLEILAAVQVCRRQPFQALQSLVLRHIGNISGCICILLDWDEPRQELVRRLRALAVPLHVIVICPRGDGAHRDLGPMAGQVERFHVLEAGKVAAGLAQWT